MKRQPTDWEETFANHISNEWLVFKMYEDLTLFNSILIIRTQLSKGQKLEDLQNS
jgi:hypothetical protein